MNVEVKTVFIILFIILCFFISGTTTNLATTCRSYGFVCSDLTGYIVPTLTSLNTASCPSQEKNKGKWEFMLVINSIRQFLLQVVKQNNILCVLPNKKYLRQKKYPTNWLNE